MKTVAALREEARNAILSSLHEEEKKLLEQVGSDLQEAASNGNTGVVFTGGLPPKLQNYLSLGGFNVTPLTLAGEQIATSVLFF